MIFIAFNKIYFLKSSFISKDWQKKLDPYDKTISLVRCGTEFVQEISEIITKHILVCVRI